MTAVVVWLSRWICTCVLFLWWCPMINNSQNSVPDRYVCARVLCSFVLPFLFLLFFSRSFSARSFLLVVRCSRQNGLGAAQIYTYAKREKRVQAVFSFFSILFFRVTVHSYMYACARSMNGYNITYKHTYIYIIKRKEAKLRPEQKKKLALISFSLSLLFFCSISRIMTTIFHCLFSNFAFWQIKRTKEQQKEWPSSTRRIEFSQYLCKHWKLILSSGT
jgi:hypothetical protein